MSYDQFVASLNDAFHQQRKRVFINVFKNGFNTYANQVSLEKLYDLIGYACFTDQSFFMEKLYWPLYKFLKRALTANALYEMEKYLLSKFTLFPGEQIIITFNGRVVQNDNQVKGRIYLTKYRLIAQGKWGPTAASSMAWGAAMSGGGAGSQGGQVGVGLAINYSIQKAIQKQVQESMGKNFSKACFGYQYPISNHYSLRRSRKNVKYRVDVEVRKRNKYKRKVLKMKVIPYINVSQNIAILTNTIEGAPIQF
ncbi:MAG: hypothetical protein ACTSR8_10120 [Promethearchaeota archaeon]